MMRSMKQITHRINDYSNITYYYNKHFKTDRYEVYYNSEIGLQVLRGINGLEDPIVLDYPILLDIGIMGHCKNKCAICYQGNETEKHMSLKNFKLIMDQIKYRVNEAVLGGRGDPNHHPQFKEIVEYAIKRDVVPTYTTSGFNLTDEQIEISKMCGTVAVSDYGQDYTYTAIKRFQEANIKTSIHLVFTSASYEKCILILHGHNPWKRKINLDKINAVVFLLFKPVGNAKHLYSLQPKPYHISVFSELILERKGLTKIGIDACLVNHIKKIPKYMEPLLQTCNVAKESAYISPSLIMTPCSFIHSKSPSYKITRTKTIEKIWNTSNLFKSFRRKLKKQPNVCPIQF